VSGTADYKLGGLLDKLNSEINGLEQSNLKEQLEELQENLKKQVEQIQEENLDLKTQLRVKRTNEARQVNKWKPKYGETYYFIGDCGEIFSTRRRDRYSDWRLSQSNCYQTEAEAEQYLDHLNTRAELQAVADELNKGKVMDWADSGQRKYHLYRCDDTDVLVGISYTYGLRSQGTIYCVDENFLKIAIHRIGKQRLADMLRSGV
jgi:hypothetical protein